MPGDIYCFISRNVNKDLEVSISKKAVVNSTAKKVTANLVTTLKSWGIEDIDILKQEFLDSFKDINFAELRKFIKDVLAPPPNWGYREPNAIVRELCRAIISKLYNESSTIEGLDNLIGLEDKKVVLMGNHTSALDVHLLDTILANSGFSNIANSLTAVVGYKTFELPFLRQMSLCFGTLKVPQSSSINTGTLEMKTRDIVRYAKIVLGASAERLNLGDKLVVFPEGTRSRNGNMLPRLPAIARYVRDREVTIVPFGLVGSRDILPTDKLKINKAAVHLRIGKPLSAAKLLEDNKGEARNERIMHSIGSSISDQIPSEFRGYYASEVETSA